MKIGNLELGDFPLLLAPMEDVSDPPFRALCKEQGADVVYTEFISSEGLIRDAAKSVMKLDIYEKERPVGIQIFGAVLDSRIVFAGDLGLEGEFEVLQGLSLVDQEGVSPGGFICSGFSYDSSILHGPELGQALPAGEVLAVEELLGCRWQGGGEKGKRGGGDEGVFHAFGVGSGGSPQRQDAFPEGHVMK